MVQQNTLVLINEAAVFASNFMRQRLFAIKNLKCSYFYI